MVYYSCCVASISHRNSWSHINQIDVEFHSWMEGILTGWTLGHKHTSWTCGRYVPCMRPMPSAIRSVFSAHINLHFYVSSFITNQRPQQSYRFSSREQRWREMADACCGLYVLLKEFCCPSLKAAMRAENRLSRAPLWLCWVQFSAADNLRRCLIDA